VASFNEGIRAFEAAEALEQARRVKINSDGKVEYADADAVGDGVVLYAVDSGDSVAVRMFNTSGTFEIAAAGAFSSAAAVYAAADDKVQALPEAAGTYLQVGRAVEAATADGDIVEFYPAPDAIGASATVSE